MGYFGCICLNLNFITTIHVPRALLFYVNFGVFQMYMSKFKLYNYYSCTKSLALSCKFWFVW